MEGKKDQALIRSRAFCAASDQSLDFFVTHEHLWKTLFSLSAHLKAFYEYKYMKNDDLGKHSLLLNKLGFRR